MMNNLNFKTSLRNEMINVSNKKTLHAIYSRILYCDMLIEALHPLCGFTIRTSTHTTCNNMLKVQVSLCSYTRPTISHELPNKV